MFPILNHTQVVLKKPLTQLTKERKKECENVENSKSSSTKILIVTGRQNPVVNFCLHFIVSIYYFRYIISDSDFSV